MASDLIFTDGLRPRAWSSTRPRPRGRAEFAAARQSLQSLQQGQMIAGIAAALLAC